MKDTRRDSEVLTAKTVASFVHDEYREWLEGYVEGKKDAVTAYESLLRLLRCFAYRRGSCSETPSGLKLDGALTGSPSASSLKGASIRAYSRLDVAGSACAAFFTSACKAWADWVTSAEIPRRPRWGMFDLSSVIQVSCSRFVECSEFTEFVYNIARLIVESTEPACRTPSLSRISRGRRHSQLPWSSDLALAAAHHAVTAAQNLAKALHDLPPLLNSNPLAFAH
ncbi:hypothetical protein GQ600_24185 [Phytophthora cactorum]|nr:hypothetical protein GQ600_24185 [Phytophthora cactorum]